jgi:hypothetical protein
MEREALDLRASHSEKKKGRATRRILAAANVMSADRTRRNLKVPEIKDC